MSRRAIEGYSSIAPYYDRYTAHPDFERWVLCVEQAAREHGFDGGRVLDAACGTGATLQPLLALGHAASGFDGCPEMLAVARRKLGPEVGLDAYDVTELPLLGEFALITWLGDACNCLLDQDSLAVALERLAANLEPDGVLVFDASTLATFSGVFAERHVREDHDLRFVWEGHTASASSGVVAHATLSVFDRSRPEGPLVVSEHVQRHHPHVRIAWALDAAGLSLVACLGQEPDGELTRHPRDGQPKRLYVARKPFADENERRGHAQGQAAGKAGDSGALNHEARLRRSARAGSGAGDASA
jgi:SAM-dependent methyltransferase